MECAERNRPPVVIVGGGLSGALAARLLTDAGIRVVLIEAGDDTGVNPANTAEEMNVFGGAPGVRDPRWAWGAEGMAGEWLRVRALGGRSRVWGGWFSPCPAMAFAHDEEVGGAWPFPPAEMVRLQREVAKTLRILGASVEHDTGAGSGRPPSGSNRLSEHVARELRMPVRPRRVLRYRGHVLRARDLLGSVAVHAGVIALHLAIDRSGEIQGVVVRRRGGDVGVLRASEVLLAASPIETARILLETARVERFPLHSRLGAGLVDHLVTGRLAVSSPSRSVSLSLPESVLIPRFVNVGHCRRRDYPGGFSIELSGPFAAEHLPDALRDALPAGAGACPGSAVWVIHALGEMFARPGRGVHLDDSRRDALGRATPCLRLSLDDEERRMLDDMDETCEVLAAVVGGPDAVAIPTRAPRETFLISHEAGTCGMGRGAEHVVDLGGCVRGLRGVRVVDASIMPTATDRHPTCALLALTFSVVSSLLRDLEGRPLDRRSSS